MSALIHAVGDCCATRLFSPLHFIAPCSHAETFAYVMRYSPALMCVEKNVEKCLCVLRFPRAPLQNSVFTVTVSCCYFLTVFQVGNAIIIQIALFCSCNALITVKKTLRNDY